MSAGELVPYLRTWRKQWRYEKHDNRNSAQPEGQHDAVSNSQVPNSPTRLALPSMVSTKRSIVIQHKYLALFEKRNWSNGNNGILAKLNLPRGEPQPQPNVQQDRPASMTATPDRDSIESLRARPYHIDGMKDPPSVASPHIRRKTKNNTQLSACLLTPTRWLFATC